MKTDESIFRVWREELGRIFHDEGMVIFLILVPIGYPLLYTFIYSEEVVREVPAVVVDEGDSRLSREFVRRVNASPDVEIAHQAANMGEAKELMRRGEAYGIIYLPADFGTELHTGGQAHVSLFCDMSGLLYYKSLLLACTDVSLLMGRELQIEAMPAATLREEETATMPIAYESIALFNPQTGFASFIIPAVLIIITQQTLLLGAGLAAGTERDRRRSLTLSSVPAVACRPLTTVVGKALAYLTLHTVTAAYVLMAVPHFFGLLQLANLPTLLMLMVPYLLATVFFALAVSLLIPNREAVMLVVVFTSLPLLFLSGISWPESAVPALWKGFSWLFPSTFGISGYTAINSMGANVSEIATPLLALWVQAAAYFLLTWWGYTHLKSVS